MGRQMKENQQGTILRNQRTEDSVDIQTFSKLDIFDILGRDFHVGLSWQKERFKGQGKKKKEKYKQAKIVNNKYIRKDPLQDFYANCVLFLCGCVSLRTCEYISVTVKMFPER